MTEPILRVENLTFSYEHTPVLERVNFQIFPGEFVGIFGPNGGGKTTLLHLLLGLLKPTQGTIHIWGTPVEENRCALGYVPQNVRMDRAFPISVLEVVMLGSLRRLSRWGRYPKDAENKARHALERVGISHIAHAPFGTLSGGQAQRALIARAIVEEPPLLLLDEPTASIDVEAEHKVYELLLELKRQMTILMVTHDLQTIVEKVGRLLCVHRNVSSLLPQEICEHFALGLYHAPLTTKGHFTLNS